jgi:pyruvate/2-oxoglutarate dehydrogenase complex dihydrolipoamide acyltransferase (E2) component
MVQPGDDWQNVQLPASSSGTSNSTQAAPAATQQPESHHDDHDLKVGPAARNLIHLYKIDPNKIKATGPHGRILKR